MLTRSARVVLELALATIAPRPLWCESESPPYCQRDALNTEMGDEAYAFRDENRCEGVYRLKLSGDSKRFALRSLTVWHSDAPLRDQPDDLMQVSWSPLPGQVKLRISVLPLDSPI